MVTSLLARRLTEAHRLIQTRIAARTTAQMLAAWPLLDLSNLDGTVERWLTVVMPIVQAQRTQSATATATYLDTFRVLETGSRFTPVRARLAPADALTTSLTVTGPVSLKANIGRGMPFPQAVDKALAGVAGAAARFALDGGRETLVETVAADPQARGWARVTSGGACDFCEMLADRGTVYSEQTVDFASHDHCNCTGEPAYGDGGRPARAFFPSAQRSSEADRARVRDWIAAHPTSN